MLLLAVVLVVLWALVRGLGGGEGPASGESRAGGPSTEATAGPEAAQSPTVRQIRKAKQRARRDKQTEVRRLNQVHDVSQSFERPSGPCDLTQVMVVPEVSQPAYAGTAVTMRIGLRSEQPTTCTIDLDPDRLLVSVTSDGVPLWSSTACPDAVPQRDVVLRPYWTSTVDLQWSGQRSGRRCASDEDYAAPGNYELQVAALTGEPASSEFTLADPAPVEPPVEDEGTTGDGKPDEREDAERPPAAG
jgi:hypothetical protein